MPLQDWIHHWEVGAGAKLIRIGAAIMAFVAVAGLYNALAYQSFTCEEAMETAQVARNLARGKGYTTESIRPLAVHILRNQAAAGQEAEVLFKPVPDITTPPVYPLALAGLMKVLPFDFNASQYWYYAPERWIALFNQVLFFVSVVLLFRIARRLFDLRVAWLSAVLFAGSNLFWKFAVSGLSTTWLEMIFLGLMLGLVHLQEREQAGESVAGSVVLAALAGLLVAVGGLTRYSFCWMILPVMLYIGWVSPRARLALCSAAAAAFLLGVGPWMARNVAVSGSCFGTAGYAILQQTSQFPGDVLERSFDLTNGLRRIGPLDVVDKIIFNAREIWRSDLPRMGGGWASAFFLVGLLIPFRSSGVERMRILLVVSLAVLLVAQAAGATHLSGDSPEINSENLLALAAPLVFMYGVALFYTLLDQLHLVTIDTRGAVIGIFALAMVMPLLMTLLLGRELDPNTPYSPLHMQRVGRLMKPEELMISDAPGAVAWYGDRPCGWLPLDDGGQFEVFNGFKPIKAVFLTQKTTNNRFLESMAQDTKSWGYFAFECQARGETPSGFPLTKAPTRFLPDQVLVSDRARWRMAP